MGNPLGRIVLYGAFSAGEWRTIGRPPQLSPVLEVAAMMDSRGVPSDMGPYKEIIQREACSVIHWYYYIVYIVQIYNMASIEGVLYGGTMQQRSICRGAIAVIA